MHVFSSLLRFANRVWSIRSNDDPIDGQGPQNSSQDKESGALPPVLEGAFTTFTLSRKVKVFTYSRLSKNFYFWGESKKLVELLNSLMIP